MGFLLNNTNVLSINRLSRQFLPFYYYQTILSPIFLSIISYDIYKQKSNDIAISIYGDFYFSIYLYVFTPKKSFIPLSKANGISDFINLKRVHSLFIATTPIFFSQLPAINAALCFFAMFSQIIFTRTIVRREHFYAVESRLSCKKFNFIKSHILTCLLFTKS